MGKERRGEAGELEISYDCRSAHFSSKVHFLGGKIFEDQSHHQSHPETHSRLWKVYFSFVSTSPFHCSPYGSLLLFFRELDTYIHAVRETNVLYALKKCNISDKQLQQNMQPTASFLTSPSPTGSATESNSYSPTGSLNYFTPSPPDALKAAVNGQNSAASSSSLAQLPLLFQTPAVSGVLNGLPTTAVRGTSLPDSLTTTPTGAAQIAMPVAINPLLSAAACSSSAVQAAAAAASNRNVLAAAAATLPSVIDNGQFFQSLLANVRLLEQKMCAIEKQQRDEATSSAFVDVCSM